MHTRARMVTAVLAVGATLVLGTVPAHAAGGSSAGALSVRDADVVAGVAMAVAPTAVAARPAPTDLTLDVNDDFQVGNRRSHLIFYTYNDLLGRDPDSDGLVGWSTLLRNGAPRSAVATGITHSFEYRARLVTDAYEQYLGRGPDPAGLNGWVAAMDRGWTVARIGSGFIASQEYYERAGGTRDAWITALYRDVLDREPSSGEVAAWGRALARGENREGVALGFLLSTEHLATVVDGYYMTLLRRHLDPVGLRGWVGLLQAGHHDEEIVAGIVASEEYWNVTAVFPLDRLVLTPRASTVDAGTPVSFRVEGFGEWDYLGDLTGRATFALDGAPCQGATCTATTAGAHVVTATIGEVWTAADVAVERRPLTQVTITPSAVTIADGASHVYAAEGFDAYGNSYGDVTSQVTFAVDGFTGACAGARCRPTGTGDHVVTAVGLNGSATLTMTPPGPPGAALWGWGDNLTWTFGDKTEGIRYAPARIGTDTHWEQIANNAAYAVGTKTDGSLWVWGMYTPCPDVTHPQGTPEQFGYDRDWAAVAANQDTMVGLKDDGSLWAWGDLSFSAGPERIVCEPTQIGTARRWRSVSVGLTSWAAIAQDGSLWMWGENDNGQLGDGTRVGKADPTLVDAGPWARVAPWSSHTVGLKADGTLWAWGDNSRGSLGDGTRDSSVVPLRVGSRTDWTDVAVTPRATVAVDSAGALWGWGATRWQTAPSSADLVSPTLLDDSRRWSRVEGGPLTRFALAEDGSLWGIGANTLGQLGDGTGTSSLEIPVQAGGAGGWSAVVPAWYTTLALRDPAAAP